MSAPLVQFAISMENMDQKTLIAYAKTQAKAWEMFAESLEEEKGKPKPARGGRGGSKVGRRGGSEPKPEEPVAEPKTEEPVAEPKPEEPVAEPKTEEPVAEPKTEEPVAEPKTEEPVAEPKPEEPVEEFVEEPKTTEEVYEWFDKRMEAAGYAMKVFEMERVRSDIGKYLPEVEDFSEEEKGRFWKHVMISLQRKHIKAHVVFFDDEMIRLATPDLVYQGIKSRFPDLSEEESLSLIRETLEEVRKSKDEARAMKPSRKPSSGGKVSRKHLEAKVGSQGRKRKEKPKTEEPVAEPKTEEPVAEPRTEEPVAEPRTEEPVAEPKTEEPVAEEPKTEEPIAEETNTEDPVAEPKTEKKKRSPTAYNLFIKAEMERLRAADPKINHKVSMSMAVAAWKSKDQVQVQVQEKPEVTLENILSA
jgi:hypothetical protein